MKIIVTHTSPDWDAITSVWLLKRFLPGWEEAKVEFVPAGERVRNSGFRIQNLELKDPIEKIKDNEIIHVDTGLGPLDHHQTSDDTVCAASLTWNYIKRHNAQLTMDNEKVNDRSEAIERIVKVVTDVDHFKEVFWPEPNADYQEFGLFGVLEGLKIQKPDQDDAYMDFSVQCLDALLHNFENRIWAEKEIKENGKFFETRYGKGFAIETINDSVLKLAQKMGYMIVIRKDPRKGYVRIKARPTEIKNGKNNIDLTLAYEQLKKMDPDATWYLHVSKKMLLNGTPKNPKMVPTKLSLQEIIKVVKEI